MVIFIKNMKVVWVSIMLVCFTSGNAAAQNALVIPPALTGTTFDLNIQMGTKEYVPGHITPTYGVNEERRGDDERNQ
jgi:hypothetical protein